MGSFYEIYAVLNETEQLGETDIYNICNNIMNITVTPKVNGMLMGGFQMPYSENVLQGIDSIRKPIKEMSDHNKTQSIEYIKNLCKLSAAYSK